MGSITTGIGLISGIDTASLIDSLIALESRPKINLQTQVALLQGQQTALLDINARLLNLKSAAEAFRIQRIFRATTALSSNESILTATAGTGAQPGTFQFIVQQLVSTSQRLSRGFADADLTPMGLTSLSLEFGRGAVATDTELADLNGGAGIDRGRIVVTDRAGSTATIDLTDVTTLDEVLDRINANGIAGVVASVEGDHLVITDTSGGTGDLIVTNATGDTTATDLGIAGSISGSELTGSDINLLAGTTALRTLNDGNGVLVRDAVTDLSITARDGTSFEIDLGRVDAPITTDTLLEDLNNGAGVTISGDDENEDIRFVARDGTAYDVNLTGVTTVGGLIQRVSNETGGHVELSIHADGDRLTVTDTVGGAGNLQVAGAGTNGTTTAEDLGILNAVGIGADTFDGVAIPNTISDPAALTLQHVIDRINDTEGNEGRIVASIAADGVRLQIDDTTGGGSNLIITSTAGNPTAAGDLGIETNPAGVGQSTVSGRRLLAGLNSVLVSNLNGGAGIVGTAAGSPATLAGTTLLDELFNGAGVTTNGNPGSHDFEIRDRLGTTYDIEVDGLVTVQDLIDAVAAASGGNVTMSIDGQALRVTDNTGGSGNFRIRDRNGASVASELGIEVNSMVDTVLGVDAQPIHSTDLAEITVTNRAGTVTSIDLSTAESLQDIVNLINDAGAGVTASINDAGNGLAITDTTGGSGNLKIAGNVADDLGLVADVAADAVQGTNLQLRYVSEASRLEDLNYGRGISTGSFRITDGLGNSAVVSIGSDSTTVYDVIQEINSRGLAIEARINDTGDGLILEADLGPGEEPFVPIAVEAVSGTTARDLNILGQSDAVENAFIDGSYERSIQVAASDTLEEIAQKINDAGLPVSAAVVNTGSGATPYHLSLTSGITGRAGELIVDTGGFDLGLTALSRGRDAKVFFGSDDPEEGLLITSSTNSITGVLPGVTLDLHQASGEAVQVTIDRDVESIVASMQALVTAFNDVIETVNRYDFYNTEAEEAGPLLGDPNAARVRSALYRTVQQAAEGVGSGLEFLTQVGIGVAAEGKLAFDEEKFRQAYADDPSAVENLFTALEVTAGTTEEIAPGVTVQSSSSTITARGFGDLFADLVERLTNSVDGTLTLADRGFNTRIQLLNDRIEDFDQRLEARRARLQAQFTAMETALAGLQAQSNALVSLSANTALSQSLAQRR